MGDGREQERGDTNFWIKLRKKESRSVREKKIEIGPLNMVWSARVRRMMFVAHVLSASILVIVYELEASPSHLALAQQSELPARMASNHFGARVARAMDVRFEKSKK